MFSFFKRDRTALTTIFPENFVDIHLDILPGIDDGAKTLDESVDLIKRLRSYGIKNFVTTPHIMQDIWENTPEIIQPKLNELSTHLKSIGITDVTIRAAAEYMLDGKFNTLLKQERLLTLKDNFLLVEMSYLSPPVNLYETIFDIQIAGYKPILAHPERYRFLHNNFEEYRKLKNAGCYFQLNLLSLSNYYGTDVHQMAIKLIKEKLIDFAGSDTHHQRHLSFLDKIDKKSILKLITPILLNNSIYIKRYIPRILEYII